MTKPQAAVRFDRVSKRFGPLAVLDEVSFDIPKGKAFCLLGRSGTGKSVTLRHIIGLVQPDSGQVFVEDRDITALGARAWRGPQAHGVSVSERRPVRLDVGG